MMQMLKTRESQSLQKRCGLRLRGRIQVVRIDAGSLSVLEQPVVRTDLQRAHKRNVARSLAGKRVGSIGFWRSAVAQIGEGFGFKCRRHEM